MALKSLSFQTGASNFSCDFGPEQVRGDALVETSGERPVHSLVNIVIIANLTSLSMSVKAFLVLSFTMAYHAPPACPRRLVDAFERVVNELSAS